jgi:hypothetical protein
VRSLIHSLLVRIGQHHPQALMYICPATSSPSLLMLLLFLCLQVRSLIHSLLVRIGRHHHPQGLMHICQQQCMSPLLLLLLLFLIVQVRSLIHSLLVRIRQYHHTQALMYICPVTMSVTTAAAAAAVSAPAGPQPHPQPAGAHRTSPPAGADVPAAGGSQEPEPQQASGCVRSAGRGAHTQRDTGGTGAGESQPIGWLAGTWLVRCCQLCKMRKPGGIDFCCGMCHGNTCTMHHAPATEH